MRKKPDLVRSTPHRKGNLTGPPPAPPSTIASALCITHGLSSQSKIASSGTLRKRQQGVIWGKTAASFEKTSARNLISSLANLVELHSTLAPKDAHVRQVFLI